MSNTTRTPALSDAEQTRLDERRATLRERYISAADTAGAAPPVATAGVDHLALICSDIERTVRFYTEVVHMHLTKVVANRDDPSSTHVFLDMGGGNLLAFFDFPRHGPGKTVRGIGAMHHLALKASAAQYQQIIKDLRALDIEHDIHGDAERGSVYFRDPDGILLEITTGYD
ncbi:MAG: VOC family protein [Gammaproteobacteria bacterium]|nr:VOC family protein [Gammaproteobacteria bacterium]